MATSEACRSVSLEAAGDLTGLLGHFCVVDSSAQVDSGGTALVAQGVVDGIVGMEVDAQGKVTSMVLPDGAKAKIKLGATLSAGDLVATAADGRAVAHGSTAGDKAYGRLLQGGDADDIVTMLFKLVDIDPGT